MSAKHFAALVLAMVLAVGPSSVVQIAAWAGMLTVRTVDSGLVAAAASTFDGSSPCALCRAAQALAEHEGGAVDPRRDERPGQQLTKKADQPLTFGLLDLPASASSSVSCDHLQSVAVLRGQCPEIEPPPPRLRA